MIETLTAVLTSETVRNNQALTQNAITNTSAGVPWID